MHQNDVITRAESRNVRKAVVRKQEYSISAASGNPTVQLFSNCKFAGLASCSEDHCQWLSSVSINAQFFI
jgi:hypothetical protein